uniref:Uncharacterized protein n=1 Tax=Nelumbo nucifera TaxID=4432 RepID=A0A822XUM9_NELNU|nr:TPA_asm: hypothetical protein HUJ06_025155 [Nelumbo nucifera]
MCLTCSTGRGNSFSIFEGGIIPCKIVGMIRLTYLVLYLQLEGTVMSSNHVDKIMVHVDPLHRYCVALVVPFA